MIAASRHRNCPGGKESRSARDPDPPRSHRGPWAAWATLFALWVLPASTLSADAVTVLLFPSDAARHPDRAHWSVPVHGWVFELEEDSAWRRKALSTVAERMGVDDTAASSRVFRQRAGMFLADGEHGMRIELRGEAGDSVTAVSRSDGHWFANLLLPNGAAPRPGNRDVWVSYEAVLSQETPGSFEGRAQLLEDTGISVISDIDDTIKASNVQDKRALMENTFVNEFRAIPGMAGAYREWAGHGAAFHYVSASPWQLYPALSEFMRTAGYPEGSFYLRKFSFQLARLWDFLRGPGDYKPDTIRKIFTRYPTRRFVLVGDSAEQDPEVYGSIAREFPGQVSHVFIRDVTPDTDDEARLLEAFEGLAESEWSVFESGAALQHWRPRP